MDEHEEPRPEEGALQLYEDDAGEGGAGTPAVWVQFADGDISEVERDVALLSPFMRDLVQLDGAGCTQDAPLLLPKQVGPDVLNLIMEYCRFHRAAGRSDKERKLFDERFIRLDTRRLCELTSAADALGMKSLVDLTSRALARVIEGKTPEEIRETFHLPDDLTEEEKLEPVRTSTDDPRIRLLNRLYARKRRELQERKSLREGTEPEGQPRDARTVDELLNFIDGEGAAAAAKAKAKKKKAKKRGKGGAADEPGGDEAAGGQAAAQPAGAGPARKASAASSASADALFPEDGFDDDEGTGSDLDAEQLARLDREVEEFELRLKAAATAAPKATGAQKQPEPERVAAVLSLLSGVLQTMGLGKTLQVVPAKQGGATAATWDVDRTASVRVPGGTLNMRVVSAFVPDPAQPL